MGHFPGRLPVPKVKRELRVLALPPHEVLSQLQFCRAILTERMAHRCLLCEQRLTVVHLHIRAIGALMLAAAVCHRCDRADPLGVCSGYVYMPCMRYNPLSPPR